MRGEAVWRGAIAALAVAAFASSPRAAADHPLVDAVRARDAAQVRALVKSRADVNATSDDGSTPLLWAAH